MVDNHFRIFLTPSLTHCFSPFPHPKKREERKKKTEVSTSIYFVWKVNIGKMEIFIVTLKK